MRLSLFISKDPLKLFKRKFKILELFERNFLLSNYFFKRIFEDVFRLGIKSSTMSKPLKNELKQKVSVATRIH